MRMYDYVIEDPSGIHAYPATVIAGCFFKHNSMVQIEYKDQIIDGSDVLAIMSLYAKEGDTLSFYISGRILVLRRQTEHSYPLSSRQENTLYRLTP